MKLLHESVWRPQSRAHAPHIKLSLPQSWYTTQRYSKPKVFGQRYSKTKGIRVPKVFENEKSGFAKPVRHICVIHVYFTIQQVIKQFSIDIQVRSYESSFNSQNQSIMVIKSSGTGIFNQSHNTTKHNAIKQSGSTTNKLNQTHTL